MIARIAILLVLSSLGGSAWAKPTKKLSGAEEKQFSKLVETAKANYKVQEYEAALTSYKEAYVISQEPILLFNIGQCYRQLGLYDEAEKSLQRFLNDDPKTTLRPSVEELLREITAAKEAAAKEAAAKEAVKPPPVGEPEPSKVGRVLYFGAAGAGAASLGLGIFGALRIRAGNEAQQGDLFLANEEAADLFQRGQRLGLVADIALGVAVVSGAAGLVLSRKAKKGGAQAVAPTVAPGGAGVVVRF